MNQKVRQNLLPLIAATLWGISFVFQKESTKLLGAFTFNSLRSLLGFAVLLLFVAVRDMAGKKRNAPRAPENKKALIIGGICCGTALFAATSLQQFGMIYTEAGKASFITALYIVLVPLFGLIFGKKVPVTVWIGVVIAVCGMYLLCIQSDFSVGLGDFLVFLCAIAFAVHIMIIDHFTQLVDGVKLSCIQMLVSGTLAGICALFTEEITLGAIIDCAVPILYLGIFSSGVAYTLQVVAQKGTNPTVVSIILSLESVIGVISSAILLHEKLLPKEYVGCVLMMIAVLLTQLPENIFKRKRA